ncbi:MAG: hypothetical protein EXR77_15490 [Myxococcales bacterium]|nr:hypothetical protein [Myxococcales bacterium]
MNCRLQPRQPPRSYRSLTARALSLSLALLTACTDFAAPADSGATVDTMTTVDAAVVGKFGTAETSSLEVAASQDGIGPTDQLSAKDTSDCPGGAGCVCAANKDCQSGFCIDTPNGKACAAKCVNQCAAGFNCVLVSDSSGDSTNICVPAIGKLCNPCTASKECAAVGLANSLCIDEGPLGGFCGLQCTGKTDCPADYDCKPVTTLEGVTANQCARLPAGGTETYGVCPCSPLAVSQALNTACAIAATDGSGKVVGNCTGVRKCTAAGLSACSAPPTSKEICDGIDNDCDGKVDNGACDDGNPCTQDACDPAATEPSKCSHILGNGPCDADGSACTEADNCSSGKCVAGKLKQCDDGNPCSADGCDPKTGCVSTPDNGAPCDDENLCTLGDKCFAGKCQAGLAKDCVSSDTCVVAKCSLTDGKCKFTNKQEGLSCDDGTSCTKDDVCSTGACVGKVFSCADGNPCTDDSCDGVLGCVFKLNNSPCSDGDACTIGDACKASLCASGVAKPCDDGNPCTVDACNKTTGDCAATPQNSPCSDGNACTVGDACKLGACAAGLVKDCSDNNLCTADLCNASNGDCANLANAATCTDNDPCSVGDSCQAGACKAIAAKNCSDGEPCTADNCDANTGACASKLIAGCGGNCSSATGCEDSNPCTDNKCLGGKCAFVPNSLPCDDKNLCSQGDLCADGGCAGGAAKNCDDNNPCTADSCDKASGVCAQQAKIGPCTDNNACSLVDLCSGGKCAPGNAKNCDDSNPCTGDSCQPDSGDCAQLPQVGPCDDGNACSIGDACTGGKCAGGGDKDCNDGNPCTGDGCANGSCTHAAIASNCNDSNLCTAGDACAKGICAAGPAKSCDDGNLCTADACNPATGVCANSNTSDPCSDGNACTANDKCTVGSCGPGLGKDCDDKDACTADNCDPPTGNCGHAPIPGCGGNCLSAKDCNDKNECTTGFVPRGQMQFSRQFCVV